MNYCTKCESMYREPGTCNCYTPATMYCHVACGGCGKIPCDQSTTGCPLPVRTVTTCTPLPAGNIWATVDASVPFTPTLGVASAYQSGLPQ